MGWLYKMVDRVKDVHDWVLNSGQVCEPERVVAHKSTAYGRRLWVAYRSPVDEKVLILEFMVNTYKDNGILWGGYKDVGEDCGPVDTDCPLSLLELCDEPPNDWAREWRERVYKRAESRKQGKADWSPGTVIELWKEKYTVEGKRKRSYLARCHNDGVLYRIGPSRFSQCEVVG